VVNESESFALNIIDTLAKWIPEYQHIIY